MSQHAPRSSFLHEITPVAPEALLGGLLANSAEASKAAGKDLINQARKYGIEMRDYLNLAIDPTLSEKKKLHDLDGYAAALAFCRLPTRDNFKVGATLDLAGDTFATMPGTRALFPEVMDDMVRWQYGEDQFENTAAIVGGSRTINGVEMITTIIPDEASDYEVMGAIGEMAPVPMHSVVATQQSVKLGKFGGGYRMSYEFQRRARLDIMTPYLARQARHLERSKVAFLTSTLINGEPGVATDGTVYHGPAPIVTQSSFNAKIPTAYASTNGVLNRYALLAWLVARAQAGYPVDTVVGNYDAYLQWLFTFQAPLLGAAGIAATGADVVEKQGFTVMNGMPIIKGVVNFALSSTMPAGQLLGITKAEASEELIEAGSLINESERAVENQVVKYVRTMVAGYRLPFGPPRQIYNYAN